ncbi:hypothetical protein QO034_21135 [Sedimentitalea sp. JM2-8]|uniref:NADH:ubiquinone oxidoreductase 30kDa subunit domain-containing protein n=1 Tax=Sedimentitalea xiamensis TaxID=3050037 RepID=A0ABT7FKB8_9RHOB|nr:hypothetical protein [Sedimentitalea xiamensis]MDK3075576.1 hypothetical protein [Sedimentitalea xiamensis]
MYQREGDEMTPVGHDLLSHKGKILSLITIDGVKDWTAKGIGFQCAYDLVGFTTDQKPRYRCIYVLSENSEAFVLVTTRVGKHGADVRLFNIWPGLFRHHNEFGDGRRLCFDREFGLILVP